MRTNSVKSTKMTETKIAVLISIKIWEIFMKWTYNKILGFEIFR